MKKPQISEEEKRQVNDILREKTMRELEKRWANNDVELIGRVLRCHLALEYCMFRWLKFTAPKLDFESSRLSFFQKFEIFSKSIKDPLLCGGIRDVNMLRNQVAHTFHDPFADISIPQIDKLCSYIYRSPRPQGIVAVEVFTRHACGWLEGRMTAHISDLK